MRYRPRELVVRAREAAFFLLAALDHNEMVQRFLDMYAAEYRRPGRADQPVAYREQLQTIRREAILAMTLRVEAALPTRLKVHVSVRDARKRPAQKGKKGGRSGSARNRAAQDLKSPSHCSISFARNFLSRSASRSIGARTTHNYSGATILCTKNSQARILA